jgi:hypothetical protein
MKIIEHTCALAQARYQDTGRGMLKRTCFWSLSSEWDQRMAGHVKNKKGDLSVEKSPFTE